MSEPNLDGTSTEKIHPALDFTSDHAYVGQLLPWGEPDGEREVLFSLIKDDRVIIPCIPSILEENGLNIVTPSFAFELRWSLNGIKNFIEGEEAVDPAQLFELVKGSFRTYIELLDVKLYDFLALWNIGTYFFPLFNTYPYVYVGGIKESGKTKLLTLCCCIAFNSVFSGNMSTAVVYRLIQDARCSLFIDETEMLSNRYRARDLRNILLSGYKNGQRTYRNRKTTDGNFVPQSFEVYGPKMLANIEGLEDVLGSRCIKIIMKRGLNREITNREVDISDPIWQQVRDLLYPFLMGNWRDIKQTYSELENDADLLNRNWELWKPIFALAKFFDRSNDGLYEEMKSLALEKIAENQGENSSSHEAVLVEVLLSLVDEDNFYFLREIRVEMAERVDDGGWLSERFIGRLLRRLGFSNSRRIRDGTQYFLKVSEVKDLALRLGISVDSEGSELSEGNSERGE